MIINLLNNSSNEESKFATTKWYVIDSRIAKGKYKQGDTITFETGTIKSSLCDYSDAFILVKGNITVAANNNTDAAFKNCASFSTHAKLHVPIATLSTKDQFGKTIKRRI